MARETRGSNGRAVDAVTVPTPAKRKRGVSPAATPLKVTLPSPATVAGSAAEGTDRVPTIKLNVGATNNSAEEEHAGANGDAPAKKQKISIKLTAGGAAEAAGDTSGEPSAEQLAGEKAPAGRPLTAEVRKALAAIVAEMATGLPAPMNNILALWLPPSFKQDKENTLGYVLTQKDLTFETLVDRLHIFAANLLEPCAYPNPMPSLARLHLPATILPSSLRPHAIYNFCAALHPLMLRIEPPSAGADETEVKAERWALVQKVPGPRGESGAEWFTAMVNPGEAEKLAKTATGSDDTKDAQEGLLAKLAAQGGHFGYAQPVMVQAATAGPSKAKIPTLADSVIRKASLKAQRWKEASDRNKGYFGSVRNGVSVPEVNTSGWTPTFGPMYDSTHASGGSGYWLTVDRMHQKAKLEAYHLQAGEEVELGRKGWAGLLDDERETAAAEDVLRAEAPSGSHKITQTKSIDDMLNDNAALLQELRDWQHARVRNGQGNWVTEREDAVAEEVSETLARLASRVAPSQMLSKPLETGSAHAIAKRIIHGAAPSIRGTLDPRRPRALHDNATVRLRPAPLSSVSSLPPLTGTPGSTGSMGGPRPPYPGGTPGNPGRYPNYRPPQAGHVSATPQRMNGTAYYPSPAGGSAQPGGTPVYNNPRAPGFPQTPGSYGYGQVPGGPGHPRPGPGPAGTPAAVGGGSSAYGTRNGPGQSALRQNYAGARPPF